MARFAVVRVSAEDGMAAQGALTHGFAPVTMTVNTNPPAAGPEWEFAIQDRPEERVVKLLRAAGIAVLAAKTELRAPMAAPDGLA
jgi:hypothetical protein